ncbi:MAG: SGNH/GDSL hydrolase family protein, partial [Planctomycetes bacterium]|nr:SGNH/GDSL hydrolase family protein [Planctomycetota bacterium]
PHAFVGGLVVCMAVMLVAVTVHSAESDVDSEPSKVFSGEPKLIVVTGYSTSFHWWAFLQRKIDRYTEGERTVEVRPATRGGTPIARWMDVATGQPRQPWTRILRPALQAKGDRPAIVLAQQSLQWVFGEQREGIRNEQDSERIKQGADALEKYVRLLLEDGADVVFVGMHIYKKPMEPGIGNERLALAELMTRKVPNVFAGPDVWEPTRQRYPKAFAGDRLHPNSIGAEIMAQMWFETLLKHDGLEVPEWSRQEMAEAVEKDPVELREGGFQRLLREWGIRQPT